MTPRLEVERIRAIFFDLDGTLIETDDHYVQSLARSLRLTSRLTRLRDPEALARRLVMAAEGPTNALLSIIDRLALDEISRPFLDRVHHLRGEADLSTLHTVSKAHEVLSALSTRCVLALVTAREARSAEAALQAVGLHTQFQLVTTAGCTRRAKPHPAPVEYTAQRLGLNPEACLMVGDTTVDIRSGRGAGAQTVGVLSGFGTLDELQRVGADVIIHTIAALPPMLIDEHASV